MSSRPSSGLSVGRPAVEKSRVIAELTRRIVTSEFRPGDRLPTRRELCGIYGVSQITIQQVIDQLVRDGFVESRGALGTFVATHPPHLFNYALVFPATVNEVRLNRFWTALANEANSLHGTGGRRFKLWYGIDGHGDSEDHKALLGDVRRGRLAGIIFPALPWLLDQTPLLETPDVPRVAVSTPHPDFPMVGCVALDGLSFVDKAIDHLISRGRKRIALMLPSGIPYNTQWKPAFDARGLQIPEYRVQSVGPAAPESARNLAHLLCRSVQPDRPDALIIADDNMVEHATAGLIDAGVRFPDDMDVVAHCNFPWPTPSVVPVRRLGYDARRVMAACVGTLEQLRTNKSVSPVTIPAEFEDQIRF